MEEYIAIVDYGVGNLKSVSNALAYLGESSRITGDPRELEGARAIILPGVGAFPDAADKLRASGLDRAVLEQGEKKPVLGICLGMQLLLEQGEEIRPCPGLGVITGRAARIPTGRTITGEDLERVEQAEDALFALGFTDFRVRLLAGAARIQLPEDQWDKAAGQRKEILAALNPWFSAVTLDLETR